MTVNIVAPVVSARAIDAAHAAALTKAQAAAQAKAPRAAACPWYPQYHFAAPSGWINDPNGLIHFKGQYHLFYQHEPYSPKWGPMHWGHAVSTDLLRWKHLPIALAPSDEWELYTKGGGCFSGSAIDNDGVLTLMYTAHVDDRVPKEVQCIATSSDGVNFAKSPANPVISASPPDGSGDFRDPKVWRHGEFIYAICGTCRDNIGKVVIYRSRNLLEWEYMGVAAQSDGTTGSMWECPDLFELDGQHVLIYSPMGLGRPIAMYLVGRFDYTTCRFQWHSSGLLDHGSDFYAPQTMVDATGRRILIAWMQGWGSNIPTEANGWSGAMTLPRELRLVDGKLVQRPVREVESLRQQTTQWSGTLTAGQRHQLTPGTVAELSVHLEPSPECSAAGLLVRMSADGTQRTSIIYNPASRLLTLNRDHAGAGDSGEYRAPVVPHADGSLDLRIFLDRSSVEVFAQDGEAVLTSRIYPDVGSTGVAAFAEGGNCRVQCQACP